MFTHLKRWRDLPNGTIHSKKPMPHDTAQDLINEFTAGAMIDKIFTTHCLRRGGAQYRFMFAPIGKRWSLSIVDTLMRYLLDSLQSYESGHGDALYPFVRSLRKVLWGDHNSLQPPTTAEFRLLGGQILTKLISLGESSVSAASIAAAMQGVSCSLPRSPPVPPTSSLNPSSVDTGVPGNPINKLVYPVRSPSLPNTLRNWFNRRSESGHACADGSADSEVIGVVPIVGDHAWKRAIDQWYHADPTKGLTTALKDWPKHWYSGHMRVKTGVLYSARKLLAEEYERFGSDDMTFKAAYPEYRKITLLLSAIRQRNGRTRRTRV
ncbi:hypothetical protein C8J57DRAFT_1322398 [Mycena rebaudengoi]|nr:hypothetical protein C8J57DRAFT_1322398 [Mycena rebaudengoi]